MSTHDAPGSRGKEGARYVDDIKAGNDALDAFMKPIHDAMKSTVSRPAKPMPPLVEVDSLTNDPPAR
jgi:hypothetical protein